jgi:hypothetical protein
VHPPVTRHGSGTVVDVVDDVVVDEDVEDDDDDELELVVCDHAAAGIPPTTAVIKVSMRTIRRLLISAPFVGLCSVIV